MKRYILHILPFCLGLLLTSCLSELEGPQGKQRGSFSLGIVADSLDARVETRAVRSLTAQESSRFLVSLTDAYGVVWQDIPYADLTPADRTQPVADGYVLTVQNCTASEAESANDGWGQCRFRGQSDPFSIVKGQDTPVQVKCHMANAGLCVVFDESFTQYFTSGYAVTTDDPRALRFDASNQALFDADDHLTGGTIAYYNTDAEGLHTVRLVITGSAGWDGTLRLTRTLTLQQGRTYRLHVRKGEQPQEGQVGVTITYDDALADGVTEEIELN